MIDINTKQPVKTDIVAEKFDILNEFTLGEHKKFILPQSTEVFTKIEHKNNLSDLDFNKHVNNKSYINLAEMTATDEFRKTHKLKSMSVKFNRETFLDDNLTCTTYRTDLENIYTHIIEKDGTSICEISTTWEKKENKDTILYYDLKVKSE